ncbi:MAG TPA: hypothetical protein VEC57_06625 [Candidatus Limnocylindrales bacterium]|nr:hypothetical protein [Candidatus Limnocylindrales bacterium]
MTLVAAGAAHAADTCKAKIDKKTGVISLAATNVAGLVAWYDGGNEALGYHAFDYGNCVVKDDDMVCPLGAADSPLATIPPPSCVVCIEDGTGNDCCARIKGCTPGVRDCVQVNESIVLGASSAGSVTAQCPIGYAVMGGGGSSTDPFDMQQLSVSRPSASEDGFLCKGFNHNGVFSGNLSCAAICCRRP